MGDDLSFFLIFMIPNYILAALTYTLLGRIVLSFLFRAKPNAVINRVFAQITKPVVNVVRFFTPKVVADPLVLVLGLFWLTAMRVVLLLVTRALGLVPMNVT